MELRIGDMALAAAKQAVQHTLKAPVHCDGVGLHSGKQISMTLRPAPSESGVVFRRIDLPGEPRLAADWRHAVEAPLCTLLKDDERGVQIMTIEHLMAALSGCGVDNVLVDLSGSEVPVMDGSAAPFVALIDRVGRLAQKAPRRAIRVLRPVHAHKGQSRASLLPDDKFEISCAIDFDNTIIGTQAIDLTVHPGSFRLNISPARSFGFLRDVEAMQASGRGLGGSLDNVVIIDGDHVVNEGGLRFADEFVRHKVLDIIGDLYLAGAPLLGRYQGDRPSHALTRLLLIQLFADAANWAYADSSDSGVGSFWDQPARTAAYA